MKRYFLPLLSIILGTMLLACDKPAENKGNASTASKIVIGLDDHFPPMGFRDAKNQIVGFDIDLAKETGKRLGMEVVFKPIDWSAKEAELNGKRIDVLWNGLTITEERKANILFTKPYLENHQIIILTAKSPLKAKSELAGRVIGLQEGSSAVDAVKKDPLFASIKEIKKFPDNVTALLDLNTGRLDAVVVDEIVGRYYVSKKPEDYKVLDEHFGREEFGIGTRKEDTALMSKIDKVLDDMKRDGSATEISVRWFGRDIIKR